MMLSRLNWSYWKSFRAVCETGSLTEAARHLGVSQPTVGRHIDELESIIGKALFTRSQAGLTPTPLALTLLPDANAMADAAYSLVRQTLGGRGQFDRSVRITSSEIVGVEVLPPILSKLNRSYPDLRIELVLSNNQDDLLTRGGDLAVRMTTPKQDRLVRVKLGIAKIGLYAHKDYISQFGMPIDQSDFSRHHLIGVDRDWSRLKDVRVNGQPITDRDFSFRCDSDIGQLAAVRAGLGIGGIQVVIAEREPALVPVGSEILSPSLDVWLAMHEDLRSDPVVRLVFQYLKTEISSVYA